MYEYDPQCNFQHWSEQATVSLAYENMHKQDDLMVHIIQRVTNQDNTNEAQLFQLQKGGENKKASLSPRLLTTALQQVAKWT